MSYLVFDVKIVNDSGSIDLPNVPAANYLDSLDYALGEAEKQGLDLHADVFTCTVTGREA